MRYKSSNLRKSYHEQNLSSISGALFGAGDLWLAGTTWISTQSREACHLSSFLIVLAIIIIFACIFASASLSLYIYIYIHLSYNLILTYLISCYPISSHLIWSYLILSDLHITMSDLSVFRTWMDQPSNFAFFRPRFQGQRFGDQGAKGWADNEKIHKWRYPKMDGCG